MNYESIADIYSANNAIRERFTSTATGITTSEAAALPDGEKWSLAELVEHIALVNGAMCQICTKLMTKSQDEGNASNGRFEISDNFIEKAAEIADKKLEAPDFVRPEGGKSIQASLAVIEGNNEKLESLRPLFEAYDGNTHKFPHPFFGDLSAVEWLLLIGRHEGRHTAQIVRILEKIRQ